MSYEPEADILRIEASQMPIEYATEIGNVIVHFSPDGIPVYFEILEATKFLKQAFGLVPLRFKKSFSFTSASSY